MGNPFKKLADIKKTVTNVARMPQYNGRTNVMMNEERGTRNTRPEFTFTPYTIKPKRPGDVPINVALGPQNQPKAANKPIESQVPRERWIRDTTAQQQGPRKDGQMPGMAPYVGPYAGNSQRVPIFLDPRTKRYTPGSPTEYQSWLDGSAFGMNAGSRDMPRFSGMTPTDLEMANVRRAQNGLGTLSRDAIGESALQSVNQMDTAQRKAWADAMNMEDASDRAAKRNTVTTLGGIGRSIGDAAERVYGALAANTKRYADPYAAIERIRLNRGAPDDNVSEAEAMPAYTGGGYSGGGYGGGGWGGGGGGGGSYDPVTKKWLANMASWRI